MPRRKEKSTTPRRIAADDEARGRRFYEHQDSLPRETERNPGFLSRIGAARNATDEDSRAFAAFSLTCRDLLSHAFVVGQGGYRCESIWGPSGKRLVLDESLLDGGQIQEP
jgi:hypothetical protein